jgi:hypothetical protein
MFGSGCGNLGVEACEREGVLPRTSIFWNNKISDPEAPAFGDERV